MSGWIRLFTIVGLVSFHLGCVSVMASGTVAPVVLIGTAVAWTVLLGFPDVLVPLCLVFGISDIVLYGSITPRSLYGVMVAYAVSFLMKRTLLGDRSGFGTVLLSVFSGLFSVGYIVYIWLIDTGSRFLNHTVSQNLFVYWPATWHSVWISFVVASVGYGVLARVLGWIERVIRASRQQHAQYSIK